MKIKTFIFHISVIQNSTARFGRQVFTEKNWQDTRHIFKKLGISFQVLLLTIAYILATAFCAPASIDKEDLETPEKEDLQTAASHWGGWGGYGHYGGYYPSYGYWGYPSYGYGHGWYGWPYGYYGHHGYWW